MVNDYAGPVRNIETQQGATVRVTPNHVVCLGDPQEMRQMRYQANAVTSVIIYL